MLSPYSNIRRLQEEIARKVVANGSIDNDEIEHVCGIDVSYRNNIAYTCAVIVKKSTLELVKCANTKSVVTEPYIPGFLMLREAEPLLHTLKLLQNQFDLLLIDGHGQLHPRRCGLACYIGVIIDKPTIGIAKSLLCGSVRKDEFIEFDGDVLGLRMKNHSRKQIYVSVGNKLSLGSAIKIVKQLFKSSQSIPEPLRIADINSKKFSKFCITSYYSC